MDNKLEEIEEQIMNFKSSECPKEWKGGLDVFTNFISVDPMLPKEALDYICSVLEIVNSEISPECDTFTMTRHDECYSIELSVHTRNYEGTGSL